MAGLFTRRVLPGLALAAVVVAGCNIKTLPYFLFPQDQCPPECAALAAPKEPVKLVIVANVGTESGADFLRADRDLCELLVRELGERYKQNKTKITLVRPGQVENFKEQNPYWQTKSVQEIGRYFHADFVANIDLDKLSLYEPRSNHEFFRGLADASVTVFDLRKPDEGPVFRKEFSFQYPRRGPIPLLDDNNPVQFRALFLSHMAKELGRCFASYATDEKYTVE